MTKWKPIDPKLPSSNEQWEKEFEHYKQFPVILYNTLYNFIIIYILKGIPIIQQKHGRRRFQKNLFRRMVPQIRRKFHRSNLHSTLLILPLKRTH